MKPSLYAELKRRNVIRAGLLYIGVVWALSQGLAQVLPVFDVPNQVVRWLIVAGMAGFPFWLAFAWFFELTPEGLKLERDVAPDASITPQTGRKLDFLIIGVLALAVVLLLTDRFLHRGGAAAAPDKSIAVLPFVNLSSDKEQEYFSDGIAEDLLNLLARVQNLQVAARTSSFSFKGKNVAIPEIAGALHVANVLEGSVRKSGDEVRISAQLVRASDGYEIWSQSWDRKLNDVFAIQDEIAAAVVNQLKVKLLGEVPVAKPVDPKAYPLILQAEALLDQQNAASRKQSIEVFQQALAVSPNEARAWGGLARVYFNQVVVGERPGEEGLRLIREAAGKALAIDPDNVLALSILGRAAAEMQLDLPTAARYFQHALELEPGNGIAINSAAVLLMDAGRVDEARRLFQYRTTHDPASPTAYNNLGSLEYYARQCDASRNAFGTALRLSPGFSGAHLDLGECLLLDQHDAAGALREMQAETDESDQLLGLALVQHSLGHEQESDAALKTLIDKYRQDVPFTVAAAYAWRGQIDLAFEWLDRAIGLHDPSVASAAVEPLLDSLHGDPRWLPYLRRIGYAPEQVAKIEFKVTLPAAPGQVQDDAAGR
jgi:TolB-like protein/Tfp pilus assembly protein PilF